MDINAAVRSFAALAQTSRLEVFRRLVRRGSEGMAAGDIARALGVPHNTMSSHLAVLAAAGLVTPRREGRSVIYAIDLPGTRDLLIYLMEDCCRGRSEACGLLIEQILPRCGARERPASGASAV